MSHFAKVENGVVTKVMVAEPELFDTFVDTSPGEWVQTSYNGNIRKQFAGIGFTYDKNADVFISPNDYPSWTLDENHDWQPPTPKPDGRHIWNEETQAWDLFEE
tara:strand:- start:211 stop:522 length:312 start_codon:yes stop_codon:yes gene_type:complete